jgi:gliding motility-associated-like protein
VKVGGADDYSWNRPVTKHPDIDSVFFIINPLSGYYVCTFINSCGVVQDSVFINKVFPDVTIDGANIVCLMDTTLLVSTGGVEYIWRPNIEIINVSIDSVLVVPSRKMTYTVIGKDISGCLDTAFFTVELYPNTRVSISSSAYYVAAGDEVILTATGSAPGGSYSWSPPFQLTCTQCQITVATPDESFTYYVEFTDDNGCKSVDEISIVYSPIVYVPNSFTPDGDQFNQDFKIYGLNLADFSCEIYNRWGELIHILSPQANSWDGTYLGRVVPDGVYTWKLRYTSKNNEVTSRIGFVTILK